MNQGEVPNTTPAAPAAALRAPTFVERIVGALRPRAWMGSVPGPVFQKEVWIMNKRLSTSWVRLAYGLVLLGIVTLAFVSIALDNYSTTTYQVNGTQMAYPGQVTRQLQQYQQIAPIVTVTIGWTQFVLLTLIACAFGAPAICDEKRAGTLGTLLATPVTAWQIILGKLLGRCVELGILLLIGAPLLLSLRTFGGVPGSFIIAMLALTAATMLIAAQMSILISIRVKRSGTAFFSSMVLIAVLLVLLPLGLFAGSMAFARVFGPVMNGPPPWWVQWIFVSSSPAVLMFMSIELLAPDAPFIGWGAQTWIPCVASLLGIWFLLFLASTARLRRAMLVEAGGAAPKLSKKQRKAMEKAGGEQVAGAAAGSPDIAGGLAEPKKKRRASAVRDGVSREVGDPSIQWREMQFRVMAAGRITKWISAVFIALLSLFLYWVSEMNEGMFIFMAYVLLFFLVIAASNVNATAIAGEREGRTLDVLLCAPISSGQIVWQKFLGGLYRLRYFVPALLIHFGLFILGFPVAMLIRNLDYLVPQSWGKNGLWTGDSIHVVALPMVLLILFPAVCLLVAIGTFFSTLTQRSTRASVLTLLTAVAMWLGVPLFLAVMSEIAKFWEGLRDISVLPNPFLLMGPMMTEFANRSTNNVNLSQVSVNLPSGHLSFFEFCLLLLGVAVVNLGLTFGFLRWSAAILRTRAEKK
ncbi:MAG: ABC transporter permease subunit [Phycisphaerales bacterium]